MTRARSGPHGAGSYTRLRLACPLAALGFALGLVVTGCGGGGHIANPGPTGERPRLPIHVEVRIDARHPGARVPRRFLGLSFELSSLARIAAYADRGDLVRLLRSLGPGVLRFGGVSADTQVAWTDQHTPRPAWAHKVLRVEDLRRLGRLAARSGWRVLLTIGLVHFDPRAAAREVAAAKRAIGPWLEGIEIGNEPDAYAHHRFRALPWTYAEYASEVAAYRRAITTAARGIAIAGPGVSGSKIFQQWGPAEASAIRPALLTGHHYPLGCHDVPAPTIERLLSEPVRSAENQSFARYMSVSRASEIGLRIDETNSVSCGGRAGVSNTFASALWATGYLLKTMTAGAVGINFQGNPANCGGYSPLCAHTPVNLTAGILSAQPEWYALLLAKSLVGTRPLPSSLIPPRRANVTAAGFLGHDGELRLVVVDDEPPGSGEAAVSVHVGRAFPAATVLALSAPSLAATAGVRLGDQAVARDGSWRGPRRITQIPVRNGVIMLAVPSASAELLTTTKAAQAPTSAIAGMP